jgi:hypothetical protein
MISLCLRLATAAPCQNEPQKLLVGFRLVLHPIHLSWTARTSPGQSRATTGATPQLESGQDLVGASGSARFQPRMDTNEHGSEFGERFATVRGGTGRSLRASSRQLLRFRRSDLNRSVFVPEIRRNPFASHPAIPQPLMLTISAVEILSNPQVCGECFHEKAIGDSGD